MRRADTNLPALSRFLTPGGSRIWRAGIRRHSTSSATTTWRVGRSRPALATESGPGACPHIQADRSGGGSTGRLAARERPPLRRRLAAVAAAQALRLSYPSIRSHRSWWTEWPASPYRMSEFSEGNQVPPGTSRLGFLRQGCLAQTRAALPRGADDLFPGPRCSPAGTTAFLPESTWRAPAISGQLRL